MTFQFAESVRNVVPGLRLEEIPDSLPGVPQKIYEAAGIISQVRPYDDDFRAQNPGLANAVAALDIVHESDDIVVWVDPDRVMPHNLGHELIHLRRNILEGVPKLFPLRTANGPMGTEIFLLENELEHLVVIKEEIETFPTAEHWWALHYEGVIAKAVEEKDPQTLSLHWSQLRNTLPNQIELAKKLVATLHDMGPHCVNRADYLREDMKRAMPDKKEMLLALMEALDPGYKEHICFARYAVNHERIELEPIN